MQTKTFISEFLAAFGLFIFMGITLWLLLAIFDGGYMFPGGL